MVGALGIEPRLRAPKARVLPLYYAPNTVTALCYKRQPVYPIGDGL